MSRPFDEILNEVLAIVKQARAGNPGSISPATSILVDLDFDSLQILELVEQLKDRFGVDFMAEPLSLRDLATPMTIADSIRSRESASPKPARRLEPKSDALL